jgi:hypothetical protein
MLISSRNFHSLSCVLLASPDIPKLSDLSHRGPP